MTKQIKDKYGNIYTNKFARFLGNLNNEVKQMDVEVKMIPVNISLQKDSVGSGIGARLKKVFSVFKRKK